MKKCILLLVFLILGSFMSCLQAEERIYPLYRLTILDGRIRDDIIWKDIPKATGFVGAGGTLLAEKQTFFQMGFTPWALYIGIECEEPDMEKIVAEYQDGEVEIWTEDSVEIFISPQGTDNYFQFMINAIGSRWSYEYVNVLVRGPEVPLSNWEAKAYQGEDFWSVEVRIPWEILGGVPESMEEWTFNICRNICTGGDRHTTWAHLPGFFHDPDNFRRLLFTGTFSPEKVRKIINIRREEIAANLKLLSDYKKEVSEKAKEYPALEREITSFLKNYEEIENGLPQLDTVEKADLLLKKSKNLIKEADELRSKILLEALFR